MTFPVHLRSGYESRYELLGAMSREVGEAFASRGCPIDPDEPIGERPSIYLWFNFLRDISGIPEEARDPRNRVALVNIFVDHPYAIAEALTDQLAELPNYRLLMPCVDGLHLLRSRWPTLRFSYLAHAVPPQAVCDRVDGERETGIVVTGSIRSEKDLQAMETKLPEKLRRPCREMVELMVAHPWMPFEQAVDLTLGARALSPDSWKVSSAIWQFVSARVNRRRRVALVQALQGLPVEVWGLDPWAEVCTGTIRYRGTFGYDDSGAILAGAKTCLAWGPTQFTHSYSERQLLAMAAGCATVSDDRLLVRGQLAEGLEVFDAARPADAADLLRDLLQDDTRRLGLAERGRSLVARAHLWSNRVDQIATVAGEAIAGHAPESVTAIPA